MTVKQKSDFCQTVCACVHVLGCQTQWPINLVVFTSHYINTGGVEF